jgi:import receptor subunit TOM22
LEFEDETLTERLWGLTEMFPEPIRDVTSVLFKSSFNISKNVYQWSRVGLWVAASSFTILILPIICEQERSSLEEQQQMQQRQLLLGPSAASPSHSAGMPPMLPGSIPFGLGSPVPSK